MAVSLYEPGNGRQWVLFKLRVPDPIPLPVAANKGSVATQENEHNPAAQGVEISIYQILDVILSMPLGRHNRTEKN